MWTSVSRRDSIGLFHHVVGSYHLYFNFVSEQLCIFKQFGIARLSL